MQEQISQKTPPLDEWLEVFRLAETVETTLARVVSLAVRSLDGCDAAGLTLVDDGGRPWTSIATAGPVMEADRLQYELDEGPCLDAFRHDEVFLIPSMDEETRWPRYAPRAVEAGVHASLSMPLSRLGRRAGALNLYAEHADAFDREDVRAAALFAAQASVAVANQQAYQETLQLSAQLSEALVSRAVIDQAKGIVMAREGCDADDAFDILRKTSQRLNVKLRDLAGSIVDQALDDARAGRQ